MRIALIDPSLFTLPYDRALAGGLEAAGHSVGLYARRPGPDDPDPAGTPIIPAFYRFTSSPPIAALPRQVQLGIKGVDHIASTLGLLRRFRADPPDIIHFQWLPLPALDHRLLAGFRKLAPLVLTVHDTAPSNGDPAAAVRQRGFYQCLGLFEAAIVHTAQGVARLRAKGVPDSRIALLPHGLLDAVGEPSATPDAMDGELTFTLFGKIKPYKGADLLIQAFARLPEPLRRQARVRIVGKAYMPVEPLHALAEAGGVADRVCIEPRFVDNGEIPHLFGPGVVAAFPYREIEASGVLSIALAHARPILAARIGNFGEEVEDGVQGLLVPVEDLDALRDAMARMIADRAFTASCSGRARARALAVPGWDVIGERTAALYRRLLAGRAENRQAA